MVLSESYYEVSNYKYCFIRDKFKVKIKSSNSLETIIEEEEPEDENIVDEEIRSLDEQDEENEHVTPETSKSSTTEYSGVQYVGDNIDLNIVSINGNTPFHAMGMIKVTTKSAAVTDEYLSSEIPRLRLTTKDKAKILKAGDIPIKHCRDQKKTGINSIKLKPLNELINSVSSTPSNPSTADTVWAAGWIVKKKNKGFSHANWNGWMKSFHNSEYKEVSHIEYKPIIDGGPNDHSTIYTALLRCIDEEKPKIPFITFDLPIWLKSVDIILSQKLQIIPRLGGFHLLKSFLATFGAIFADSGLHKMVQLIYPGEVVTDSILNGNSSGKAIRAHFLIDAAIVQHLLPPSMLTNEELIAMERSVNNACDNQKGIDSSDIPIAEMLQTKIRRVFEPVDNAGRTPALWSLYHYMVETIKIFIRAERMADFSLHLSCIECLTCLLRLVIITTLKLLDFIVR